MGRQGWLQPRPKRVSLPRARCFIESVGTDWPWRTGHMPGGRAAHYWVRLGFLGALVCPKMPQKLPMCRIVTKPRGPGTIWGLSEQQRQGLIVVSVRPWWRGGGGAEQRDSKQNRVQGLWQ